MFRPSRPKRPTHVGDIKYICDPQMCTFLVVHFDKTGVNGKNKLQNSVTTSLTNYTKQQLPATTQRYALTATGR